MNTEHIDISQPPLEKEVGLYNSTTILMPPERIFEFCRNERNVEKVLENLPHGVDNFLDLSLIRAIQTDSGQYEILFENRTGQKTSGTLMFHLEIAPARRGTYVSAIATFTHLNSKSAKPSELIKIFLRRMKALAETGKIPTTKGQSSGREEYRTLN